MLQYVEREVAAEYVTVRHTQDAGAAAAVLPGKNGDLFYKFHLARASESKRLLWNILFPYHKRDEEVEKKEDPNSNESLARRYKEIFKKRVSGS